MKKVNPGNRTDDEGPGNRSFWPLLAAALCLMVLVMAFFTWRHRNSARGKIPAEGAAEAASSASTATGRLARAGGPRSSSRISSSEPVATAQEIVTGKLSQFARNRREIAGAMAKRFKVEVPAEVQRFFDAMEAGRWDEQTNLFALLKKQQYEGETSESLKALWGPIMEAYGVAQVAQAWPPQQLLDYGHAILDSLRPGMIYVGGTDPGRFIPTLLNETSEGEHHIIFTQNALADSTYLQYAGFLYGDSLPTLNADDSQRGFQEYLADAQKRLAHDQQFPDEPKQIQPGEDVRSTEGRVQVSGQVAVMAINEKLLQFLMDKNPDASFAIEQSFPLKSTYASATPLGPIMEIRAADGQQALTQEKAAASLDYLRTTTQSLTSDPASEDSLVVRQAWSKMVSEQAALFSDRNLTSEAEQGFRLATEIYPSNPESVFRYVNLLMQQNRMADALAVAENGVKAAPDNQQFRGLVEQLRNVKKN